MKGWVGNFLPLHVLCSCRDAVKARAVFLLICFGQKINDSKSLNVFKALQLTFSNVRGSAIKRNQRPFFQCLNGEANFRYEVAGTFICLLQ